MGWLLGFLEKQSKPRTLAGSIVLTSLLGCLDYLTGFEVSFSFFYLIPVSLVAWSIGLGHGIIISIASAAVWLIANQLAGAPESHPLVPYWNALTRFGFFIVISSLLAELRKLLEHERHLARIDGLTGLLNRRAFYDAVALELARCKRYQHPLTIMYFDLDNFKKVNDRFGHQVGDQVLISIAEALQKQLRAIDLVSRLGGDEFTALLPETDAMAARKVIPRIQGELLGMMNQHDFPVTFSIGALTCTQPPETVEELVVKADRLMYTVKNTTKNGIQYAEYPA